MLTVDRSVVVEVVGANVVGVDVGVDVGTVVGANVGTDVGAVVGAVGTRVGAAVGTAVGEEVGGAMQRLLLVALTRHEEVLSHGLLANIAAGPPSDPVE